MFARASMVEGSADQVDAGIAKLEHDILGELQQVDGFSGILGCVDRGTGHTLVITLWETEQALQASEERANQLRSEASASLGASAQPRVERYEVVLQEMRTPAHA